MSKTYKKCDEDFKKTLVALYESGKRLSDLEREYGINESTIRAWIKNMVLLLHQQLKKLITMKY